MFFQNPFAQDFKGNLVLSDRQYSSEYIVNGNKSRAADYVVSTMPGSFNLTGSSDTDSNPSKYLNIFYSYKQSHWQWMKIDISTTAAITTAAKHSEIISALNANTTFSSFFTASGQSETIIKANLPSLDFKFYIQNGQAEELLLFNRYAGVAELPTYFVRHQLSWQFANSTQANAFNSNNFSYTNVVPTTPTSATSAQSVVKVSDTAFNPSSPFTDNSNLLLSLNPYDGTANSSGSHVDLGVIIRATNITPNTTLSAAAPNPDWKLLKGKSGLFTFRKIFLNSAADAVAQILEYPAGAQAGSLAKITKYYYHGQTSPQAITEEPYILTTGDLISPVEDTLSGGSSGSVGLGGSTTWPV